MIRFNSLQKDIEFLKTHDPSSLNLQDMQEDLRLLITHIAKRTKSLSYHQNSTLTDAPTNFFFSLEKDQGATPTLTLLKNDDTGDLLSDPSSILIYASSFYKTLYSSMPIDLNPALFDGLPTLSEEERQDLDASFDIKEFDTAVKTLSKRKSPGP